ncbi:MAG: sensor histidine kinase [Roseivirga sp.]|nr:sensor histidine kinase [Roseivirga sp.]
MLKRLCLILNVLLVLSLSTSAQDRTISELFNETERDTSWVKDLVINCYVHYVHERSLDSLDILAGIISEESERLDYYWGKFHGMGLKGEALVNNYPDSTIYYTKQGIKVIPPEDNSLRAVAYYNMAITFNRFHHYDSALAYLEQVIDISEQRQAAEMLADTYHFIGIITRSRSDYARALKYEIRALSSYEMVGDSARMVSAMENIGVTYDNLKDYEKAYKYITGAIAMAQEMDEREGRAFSIAPLVSNNLGRLLIKLKRYDEAFETLRESVVLHQVDTNKPCALQYPYYNLGNAFLITEQLDSAKHYLNKALELANSCINYYVQSLASHDLGELNYKEGNKATAKRFFKQALEGAEKRTAYTNEYIDAAYKLYIMYKEEDNLPIALQYHEEWTTAKDSLYNTETALDMARLEIEYDFDREKRALIAQQEQEQVALENELNRQKIIQWASMAVILLVLILAINFFLSLRRKKKANEVIGLQNQELQKLSGFKEGLTNMIAHDMKNSLNTILGIDHEGDQITRKKVNRIKLAGTNILNLVTNMLDVQKFEEAKVQLNPERSSLASLFEYAQAQVTPLLQEKSIRLEVRQPELIHVEVDPEIICRVLINLLTNAIKFSDNGQAVVLKASLESDSPSPCLTIAVSDTGVGIDAETLPFIFDKFHQTEARSSGNAPSTGLGLTFCKLAVEAHQGTIEAVSTQGKGTTVSFTIPIQEDLHISGSLNHTEEPESSEARNPISEEEWATLSRYAAAMKGHQIHEIKKLKEILAALENEGLESEWQKEIWSAILYGDKERYQELLGQMN